MTEHRRAYGKRKFDQIQATGATYVLTPCHNCHSQMEDIGHHFGGAADVFCLRLFDAVHHRAGIIEPFSCELIHDVELIDSDCVKVDPGGCRS